MPDKPLISFLLIAYNQERFIREAVEGALSQTYSPLEIILSDDCSKDHTFEIISEMASAYQGPHRLVLNQNDKNLGICSHINKAVAISHGELIVAAAGDDISLAHRSKTMYEEWQKAGRRACSLHSNAEVIDEYGKAQGPWNRSDIPVGYYDLDLVTDRGWIGVTGCTHVFHRKTFELFGPMRLSVYQEDEIIPFRSILMGGIHYIPDVLVFYRRHSNNLWKTEENIFAMEKVQQEEVRFRNAEENWKKYSNWIIDLKTAVERQLLPVEKANILIRKMDRRLAALNFGIGCMRGSWASSTAKLIWCAGTGRYFRGMLSIYEKYLPETLRKMLQLRHGFGRNRSSGVQNGVKPEPTCRK